MDACSLYDSSFIQLSNLCAGVIWSVFVFTWLLIAVCSPRPASMGLDLLVAFVGALRATSGYLVAFLAFGCIWDFSNDPALIPIALEVSLSNGMFAMLQLMIARGYGITRYVLTMSEIIMLCIFSAGLMVVLLIPLMGLLYLVVYVMFIIYGCRTSSLLKLQNPDFSSQCNMAIRKKRQLFSSMMFIVLFCVFLSVVLIIYIACSLYDNENRSVYLYIYTIVYSIVEVLFAGELMLLHMNRTDPVFSAPLVATDEVYLIRQSLIEQRPPPQMNPYPPSYPPILANYPPAANMPQPRYY